MELGWGRRRFDRCRSIAHSTIVWTLATAHRGTENGTSAMWPFPLLPALNTTWLNSWIQLLGLMMGGSNSISVRQCEC